MTFHLHRKNAPFLLRYGYPFERIEQGLKACASSDDVEIVPMDSFELERLIRDAGISINQMERGATQAQLLDLCERLEAAERTSAYIRAIGCHD